MNSQKTEYIKHDFLSMAHEINCQIAYFLAFDNI